MAVERTYKAKNITEFIKHEPDLLEDGLVALCAMDATWAGSVLSSNSRTGVFGLNINAVNSHNPPHLRMYLQSGWYSNIELAVSTKVGAIQSRWDFNKHQADYNRGLRRIEGFLRERGWTQRRLTTEQKFSTWHPPAARCKTCPNFFSCVLAGVTGEPDV